MRPISVVPRLLALIMRISPCVGAALVASVLSIAVPSPTGLASPGPAQSGHLQIQLSQSRSDTVLMTWQGAVAAPMAAEIAQAFEKWKGQSKRFVLTLASGNKGPARNQEHACSRNRSCARA
jgi:hypothetical protein